MHALAAAAFHIRTAPSSGAAKSLSVATRISTRAWDRRLDPMHGLWQPASSNQKAVAKQAREDTTMSSTNSDRTGLLAGIMGLGLASGLIAYFVLAFLLKMPGFDSAPAMIGCWLVALILCTLLGRGKRS
jgi:hypothetical protein